MDKRNRPALAYLLVGVASAGRAMLAMPDAVALQEVSLTVLALVATCCWAAAPCPCWPVAPCSWCWNWCCAAL